MDSKCILVTGCCGFIGSNFVNYFMKKYPSVKVVNIDFLDYCANENNVEDRNSDNYIFVKGSISNSDLLTNLISQHQFDGVIHFAANSHVDNSFGNSCQFTKNNVIGTHVLLECFRVYHEATGNLKRFLHISTDEVYGEVTDDIKRTEASILLPTNPYSATKAAAEFLVRSYARSFRMPCIITRGNNVYGKYQFPEKVIPRFTYQLMNNHPVTVHGTGGSLRAFIHVDDVVTAVETVFRKGSVGSIYNIGTDDEYNVLDVAKRLILIIKGAGIVDGTPEAENLYRKWIIYVEDRAFNDCRYHINTQNLEAIGWSRKSAFDDPTTGLESVVRWYAEVAFPNQHWPASSIPLD